MMQTLRQQPGHLKIMGMDSEWFRDLPLAVVQFATSSHCFVLHISFFDGRILPAAVKEALCDPSIIKCGVGVSGDVSRLQKEQNITIQSVLDVAQYSALFGLHQGAQSNLKVLAKSVANLSIEKDKMITRSNWELPLSDSRVNYAAEDALASYLVGRAVMLKASEVTNMSAHTFDAAQWLQRTSSKAAMELKKLQREVLKSEAEKGKKACPVSKSSGGDVLPAHFRSGTKVRVLDRNGKFIFECSSGRAKFYVMEKNLAVITKHEKSDTRKALEIQLLFDPKVKTRLCIHHALGVCELKNQCPFAHGVSELQAEAAALVDSQIPSCACCLGTKGLLRHAITPPSFRKFMPPPQRQALDDDYLPVCKQCNSTLRLYYDEEMKRCYTQAEESNTIMYDLKVVAKCSLYARLLLDADRLANMPANRREELQQFVKQNWKSTLFEDFNPGFEIHEPVEQNTSFLERLGKIVPGDTRAKVTMAVLVGDDQEKARQFNKRWRDYCFGTCGMMEKKSNHMSYNDWKAYRAHKGERQADDDEDDTPQKDYSKIRQGY
ncbi:3'-5' exonuclease [Leishmania donovani]|uniref:3'-5' exonuclease n=1 Tax=Leishmania donovani TaxID=5661 RepID=A0A504XSV3_LEIDO|nr:3'-5' exonuclease family protein [Leishmania donovani]CAJ1992477.1 3'-5' exonuclease [Leishmania donovani]VDZ48310.1 3'-5'_exonuclease [Leishmania donovani]